MSFLEKEDAEKSSFWDWVIGIVVVAAAIGFAVFYQFQKRSSTSRIGEADSLFHAGKFKEAGKLYQELKAAEYHTTKDDSLVYVRLDSIENVVEAQNAVVADCKKKAEAKDTAGIAAQLSKLPHRDLLSAADSAWVDSALSTSAKIAKP